LKADQAPLAFEAGTSQFQTPRSSDQDPRSSSLQRDRGKLLYPETLLTAQHHPTGEIHLLALKSTPRFGRCFASPHTRSQVYRAAQRRCQRPSSEPAPLSGTESRGTHGDRLSSAACLIARGGEEQSLRVPAAEEGSRACARGYDYGQGRHQSHAARADPKSGKRGRAREQTGRARAGQGFQGHNCHRVEPPDPQSG